MVYWELLYTNQTITSEVYSAQLNRFNEELQKKRPALVNRKGVILQHGNARPHVANTTLEKLKELKWEALIHLPYSPDLAPTGFHLFLSLSNFFKWNLQTDSSLGICHKEGWRIYRRLNFISLYMSCKQKCLKNAKTYEMT